MPCSSLEENLQPKASGNNIQGLQAIDDQISMLQAQAAILAHGQSQESLTAPSTDILHQFVFREGQPWPVLPPAQEAFQRKSWKRKHEEHKRLVKEVQVATHVKRLRLQYQLNQARNPIGPQISSIPQLDMTCHSAHRLADHLTIVNARKRQSVPYKRRARRGNVTPSVPINHTGPEKLSISARIHLVNTGTPEKANHTTKDTP